MNFRDWKICIHLYKKLPSTTAQQASIIYLHQWWLIILNYICINKLLWFGKAYLHSIWRLRDIAVMCYHNWTKSLSWKAWILFLATETHQGINSPKFLPPQDPKTNRYSFGRWQPCFAVSKVIPISGNGFIITTHTGLSFPITDPI